MKQTPKDLKGFRFSGNVVDLALGVIIGAVFGEPNFNALTFEVGDGEIGTDRSEPRLSRPVASGRGR